MSRDTRHGAGIGTVLFLILLAMKLLGVRAVVHLSWWWVFAPLWVPFLLVVVGGAALAVFVLASTIYERIHPK